MLGFEPDTAPAVCTGTCPFTDSYAYECVCVWAFEVPLGEASVVTRVFTRPKSGG
jgi:hypothetical protein